MRIERIIQDKGGDVITIAPGASVAEAAKLLSDNKIGAVIVCEQGQSPAGILSERDIVRQLSANGAACLDQTVSELMTTKLQSCAKDDTLDQVLTKMTDGRFRHMPVMEDGKMIALVSIGDVVKSRLGELAHERDALEGMVRGL
ncbi:inosine 5'-monophosphate dehydrogenase [Rhodobacteraceae bacterium THAF1]|uniref:CBS domain-containing protein n=1 Tax=Palleronia sp. THAF1 TaxID=2587842 RepID=UPI000F3D8F22|nr:CBS domain-containing protein [Palleronia sp. THAF1]QFU09151.1 inosine 5'-monophosphate dehydrogenase [Palleronia sp. THAF1]VDC24041.1 inosine 5'-monophosphate dehydrogenase [Rhodobacteraceae bacterium THAF1]